MSLFPRPANYYDEPFCNIYFQRGSKDRPKTNPFFENTKSVLDLNSCTVTLDSKKIDSAAINFTAFPDTVDFATQGVHEGVKVWVEMGYRYNGLSELGQPLSRIVFVGQLDRPNVTHGSDGNISISANAKALTQHMNVVKKTKTYKYLTRYILISSILIPYSKEFPTALIGFKDMAVIEKQVNQVNKTDFQFVLELARKWGCIFHQTVIGDKMGLVFTDGNFVGRKYIDSIEKSKFGANLHWRTGKRNLSSINFSGNTGGRKGTKVVQVDDKGKSKLVEAIEISGGENEGVWVLDQPKVRAYRKKHGWLNTAKLNTRPIPELLEHFYTKRVVKNPDTAHAPQREGKGTVLQGQGYLGHKAEFELVQGDVNVIPNMNAYFGGDIMARFKSTYATKAEEIPTGRPWHIFKVVYKWDSNGFNTAGTAGR